MNLFDSPKLQSSLTTLFFQTNASPRFVCQKQETDLPRRPKLVIASTLRSQPPNKFSIFGLDKKANLVKRIFPNHSSIPFLLSNFRSRLPASRFSDCCDSIDRRRTQLRMASDIDSVEIYVTRGRW